MVCLEDGVTELVTSNGTGAFVFFFVLEKKNCFILTKKIVVPSSAMLQMIVPLKEGCQKISFFGQALTKSVSFAVHCLGSNGNENLGIFLCFFTEFFFSLMNIFPNVFFQMFLVVFMISNKVFKIRISKYFLEPFWSSKRSSCVFQCMF